MNKSFLEFLAFLLCLYIWSFSNKELLLARFDYDPATIEVVKRKQTRSAWQVGFCSFMATLYYLNRVGWLKRSNVLFVAIAAVLHIWMTRNLLRKNLPRTAVTAEGVLHVDEEGKSDIC